MPLIPNAQQAGKRISIFRARVRASARMDMGRVSTQSCAISAHRMMWHSKGTINVTQKPNGTISNDFTVVRTISESAVECQTRRTRPFAVNISEKHCIVVSVMIWVWGDPRGIEVTGYIKTWRISWPREARPLQPLLVVLNHNATS